MKLPEQGIPKDKLLEQMRALRDKDAPWKEGRTFSLVYYAGDDVLDVLHDAFNLFFSENALNPTAFPSLRRFETEVIKMAASLFGLPTAAGAMTSGGTESILMAVKTARDWARATRPHIKQPEMILPVTVHPAFHKASKYFDVKAVMTPIDGTYRADVDAIRAAVTDQTIMVVGSAPAYPHGVVDPIEDIARVALEKDVLCHVDACVGGYQLPWVRRLGYDVPPFDFSVPGVTSISADLHKYGYAAKGASSVLYRDRALRRHMFCAYADWPGGLWASPTMTGTRPGGPIAAAWAVMNYLGEEGYMRIAKQSMEAARAIMKGIDETPGLKVMGKPNMNIFAFNSDTLDVYSLADRLAERGWHVDRQQKPPSLHMMITPAHAARVDTLLADLRVSAAEVANSGPSAEGSAAMYGMLGSLPDRMQVHEFLLEFLDTLDAG